MSERKASPMEDPTLSELEALLARMLRVQEILGIPAINSTEIRELEEEIQRRKFVAEKQKEAERKAKREAERKARIDANTESFNKREKLRKEEQKALSDYIVGLAEDMLKPKRVEETTLKGKKPIKNVVFKRLSPTAFYNAVVPIALAFVNNDNLFLDDDLNMWNCIDQAFVDACVKAGLCDQGSSIIDLLRFNCSLDFINYREGVVSGLINPL